MHYIFKHPSADKITDLIKQMFTTEFLKLILDIQKKNFF